LSSKVVHVAAVNQDVALVLDDQAKRILECDPGDRHCWGPRAWELLELACEYIPCDLCREHCHRMLSFEHDVVNARRGKPLYNAKNTLEYLREVEDTFRARGLIK